MTNPHFIIAGERRSGTTTLYELLKQHPEIEMYPIADMDYFIKSDLFNARDWVIDFDVDSEWHQTHSKEEYASLFENLDFDKRVGQKDADLLFWYKAHARLADYLPETKFIFILRNPIKRAESQYWNEIGKGREWKTFEGAIKAEDKRSEESDYGKLHLNYLQRGKYHESLTHFFKYVPRERVHVVILEKLFKSPETELSAIARFLDIVVHPVSDINMIHSNKEEVLIINPKINGTYIEKIIKLWDRIANAAIVRLTKDKDRKASLRKKYMGFGKVSLRSQEKMSENTLKILRTYYKKPNQKLKKLLNTDLSIWNR